MQQEPSSNPKVYPSTFEKKIGFDAVRQAIAALCISDLGTEHAHRLFWSADAGVVRRELEETAEMADIIRSDTPLGLNDITDPSVWLGPARVPGAFIEPRELSLLRRSLSTAADISAFFGRRDSAMAPDGKEASGCKYPRLSAIAEDIDAVPEVTRAINDVLDRDGNVKDSASPQLRDIRAQLSSLGGRISAAMRRVVAAGIKDGYLDADTTPSVRDGRLVIPIAPMHKRRLAGIVHDESASGKTYYIEPAEVVELNNHQRELEIEERREIVRILVTVADTIRPHIDRLFKTYRTLGIFDFINAKARYAINVRAEMPQFSDVTEFEWYGARHPVLQTSLERQERTVVPLNISLKAPKQRLLIISGPNAGGKSVALKTVAIVQYMAQCGVLPTLHGNSVMCIMENIFADIGDDQSIEDDLSTYSSHLRNMKYFLAYGNPRTLILIDEFGSGTEPQIGGAMAQALLTRFNEMGMWGVITTHYQNLKTLADELDGLVNGSMLYDRQKMLPLFTLSIGHPGSSFAIEIARKTGMPEDIIAAARDIAGSDYVNLDKYLLDIARDKRYWENKRQQVRQREKHLEQVIERYENDAETLRANRRALIEEARQQAGEIIASSNASIERTIHDIRRAQAEKEATRIARRKLEDERQALASASAIDENPLLRKAPKRKKKKSEPQAQPSGPKPIAVGDNVLLDGSGQVGTVTAIEGKKSTVNFGAMKMTVATDRLTPTIRKARSSMGAASFVSAGTTDAMRERQLNFKPEIDVRGMRADEALQAVTYFMDDAVQFNIKRVRILHGTGTGALRSVIRQYLATVSGIKDFHDEDVRFGGAGITIAEM